MDDAALLRAYREHASEDAFRELVRRHLPVVYAAALRQVNGDRHLAEDVAQRVFITLARKAGSLKRQVSLVGWLYVAARLEAARTVRTEQRRQRREEKAAVMDAPHSEEPSFDRLAPLLDQAMLDLGPEDRDAVLLRFFSGKSFGEIGGVLRTSEDAARKRVDRALLKLHQSLRRRGFVSTAATLADVLAAHAAPAVPAALSQAIATGACAQFGVGAATSVGLLMTSSKALVIAAGVFATAGVWCWFDLRARQTANEQLASARAELAAATAQQQRVAAQLGSLQAELAAATKATAPAAAPRVATPAAPAYLSDPAYRDLARASSRARRHLEFQRLYRQLNLTPEQIAAFETNMARQDIAQLDAALVRATGRDAQEVFQRSGAEWKAAMQDLLGDTGFARLEEYLRAAPVRAFIDKFAVQTAELGAAITPAQSDQLATLALANDVMYAQGKGTDPGTVNWNNVWDSAATLLTPDQLALLQRTVEVWSLEKQIALRAKQTAASR